MRMELRTARARKPEVVVTVCKRKRGQTKLIECIYSQSCWQVSHLVAESLLGVLLLGESGVLQGSGEI